MKIGNLENCGAPCAPTLEMLKMSEEPIVTLSQGKFGTQEGLDSPDGNPAPKPVCSIPFGEFNEVNYTECSGNATPLGPIEECTVPSQPTSTPSASHSLSPSSDPSPDCTEKKKAIFFWKIKKRSKKVLEKNCKWLQSHRKKDSICYENVSYGENYGPAQAVCKITCDSCSKCYENKNSKFFFKTKDDMNIYRTCQYLGGLKKSKKRKICKQTEQSEGYGNPKEVCPVTCKVDSCKVS